MDISVTLFGGLRHFLPAGSSFNKCDIHTEDGASLETLLQQIPIPENKPYIVILNDEKISRENYAKIIIQEKDEIVLLPPIKGG
ncbi:MAG: MoaD/ThiS family protein [Gammaproteobacteria bacterium]|nr:MoaD/ThiS family protein [Gammaproteobacteria bacterium]MDH3856596.1 MoaD/ThiS family protein [Gammaproteobacteria bacterium]